LSDVRGLPELAVRPPAACEEVEAAAVVADLVAPPHQPILVLDDELARRVAPAADLANHPLRRRQVQHQVGVAVEEARDASEIFGIAAEVRAPPGVAARLLEEALPPLVMLLPR